MSLTDDLSRENEQLKKENEYLISKIHSLQKELDRLRSDMGMEKGKDDASKLWYQNSVRSSLMSSKNYPKYLISLIKSTSIWGLINRGLGYFRRFRILSAVLRNATRIVVLAESGVAVVAWLSILIFMLPFVLALSIFSLLVALFRSRSALKSFEEKLEGKKVYTVFATRVQLKRKNAERGFFISNSKDLSADGSVVLIVSPFLFSGKGAGGSGFFVTARKESERIFLVRQSFFFMLRKNVINKVASENITIY